MSLASATVFLYIGFDSEAKSPKSRCTWPHHIGGHVEVIDWLEKFAMRLETLYDTKYCFYYFGGVFDYDITTELGGWLFRNTSATLESFSSEADKLVGMDNSKEKRRVSDRLNKSNE